MTNPNPNPHPTAPADAPPAGAATTAPRLIRSRQAAVSIRWIVLIAAATLTTVSVLSVAGVAERNMRRTLTSQMETRLLLEARRLALASTEALLTDFPELTLHPLVKEVRDKQPELATVQVVDLAGRIQGERDARLLGTGHTPDPGLRPIDIEQPLGPEERMLGDGQVMIATAPVLHRDGRRIGTAMVGMRRDYLDRLLADARRQQILVLGVVLAVAMGLSFLLVSAVLRPVATLRAGIERIGRGDLETPLSLRDRTEFGLLADAVDDMAAALKRAQAEMVERERLAHEVELARQIQTSLLPASRCEAGGFVVDGSQRAAAEVGGDFFDYFPLPDGRIGIAIADVAGKGLGGCLVTSMLSALLRAYRGTIASPAELLATLDERLGETLQPGSFVTMFYGVLDSTSGRMVYASAGHNPPLVYRHDQRAVEWYRSRGVPLGAVRGGLVRKTLVDATLVLEPGDLMVQFTDGINEAFDPAGAEQFGFQRIENVVIGAASAAGGCRGVIDALHHAIEAWTANGPLFDDETVLVVSRAVAPVALPAPLAGAEADAAGAEEALALLERARGRGTAITLRAALEDLPRIRDWLAGRLPPEQRTGPRFELLTTALYEACSNVAEHGYGLDPAREFELWCVPGPDPGSRCDGGEVTRNQELTFLIRDQGKPFRADNWRRTDFSDPQVWSRGRGFGLDIIHRAMSQVTYHPGMPEGNLMVLRFSPQYGREEVRHA